MAKDCLIGKTRSFKGVYMSGKFGTSMNSIEYSRLKKRKGNCFQCIQGLKNNSLCKLGRKMTTGKFCKWFEAKKYKSIGKKQPKIKKSIEIKLTSYELLSKFFKQEINEKFIADNVGKGFIQFNTSNYTMRIVAVEKTTEGIFNRIEVNTKSTRKLVGYYQIHEDM